MRKSRLICLPDRIQGYAKLTADFRFGVEFRSNVDNLILTLDSDDLHQVKCVFEVFSTSRLDTRSHELHSEQIVRSRHIDTQSGLLLTWVCGEKLMGGHALRQRTEIGADAIVEPVQ